MNKHLVFVYGTLRRGGARAMSVRFPNSKFIADAKVSGSLYDLGPYPGLILNESNSIVIGEVYEVDDEILNQLDDIEASSYYSRKQIEISLVTHRKVCWIYEPSPESYSLRTLITSGDWIEYAKTKTDWPGNRCLNGVSPTPAELNVRLKREINEHSLAEVRVGCFPVSKRGENR